MTLILMTFIGMIIAIIIGSIWHSPNTWGGRIHMRYLGFDKLSKAEQNKMIAEAKPQMWKSYLAQSILSLMTSGFIAFVMYMTVSGGLSKYFVFLYVIMIWCAFIVPVIGSNILWGNCEKGLKVKKFLADIIYQFITLFVITLVLTFFV